MEPFSQAQDFHTLLSHMKNNNQGEVMQTLAQLTDQQLSAYYPGHLTPQMASWPLTFWCVYYQNKEALCFINSKDQSLIKMRDPFGYDLLFLACKLRIYGMAAFILEKFSSCFDLQHARLSVTGETYQDAIDDSYLAQLRLQDPLFSHAYWEVRQNLLQKAFEQFNAGKIAIVLQKKRVRLGVSSEVAKYLDAPLIL